MFTLKTKKLARRNNKKKQLGQGMTEYIIIVGLIAILLIAAVKAFRNTLAATYNQSRGRLEADVTNQIGNDDSDTIGVGN